MVVELAEAYFKSAECAANSDKRAANKEVLSEESNKGVLKALLG